MSKEVAIKDIHSGQQFYYQNDIWTKVMKKRVVNGTLVSSHAGICNGETVGFNPDFKVTLVEALSTRMYYAIADLVTDIEDGETELQGKAGRPDSGWLHRLRLLKHEFESQLYKSNI